MFQAFYSSKPNYLNLV